MFPPQDRAGVGGLHVWSIRHPVRQAGAALATDYCSQYGQDFYGEVCLYGNNFSGAEGTIQSAALAVSGGLDHVNNTFWVVNGNNGDPHWIEAGMFYGYFCIAGHGQIPAGFTCTGWYNANTNPRLYWGDDKNSCECYSMHVYTNAVASLNTAYDVSIHRLDSSDWTVTIGPWTIPSTSDSLTPDEIRAGTEETNYETTPDTACSEQYNLAYWDSSDNHHDGWSGSTLVQDQPPYSWWVNTDHWARERSHDSSCYGVTAPVATSSADTAGAGSATTSVASGSTTSAASSGATLTQAQVAQEAVAFAGSMGDPNPTSVQDVEGPRAKMVLALSGDTVPSSEDVFAIVMRGQFVDDNLPMPPGASARSGSVLTLAIDATTGEVTDLGIGDQVPDLASLGPVTIEK